MKMGILAAAMMGITLAAGSAMAESKPVIGALIRNLDDQFLNDYTANLKKAAAAKGAELKIMDARSDMATQFLPLSLRGTSEANDVAIHAFSSFSFPKARFKTWIATGLQPSQ